MRFETWEPTDTKFLDYKESYNHPNNPKGTRGKIRENHQNEFNFFVKDDWKVTPTFTLNLGVRWDLFRVADLPQRNRAELDARTGRTATPAIFGNSGRSFNEAFHNGGVDESGLDTEIVLIGKDSKYPEPGAVAQRQE